MALITENQLIERVNSEIRKGFYSTYETTRSKAQTFINESKRSQSSSTKVYDIFLSHSSGDARYVAGMKLTLEDLGYSVYVDWIEDPELDRSAVTKKNAAVLRSRMRTCKSLLYAFSQNASKSTWMPWELGYFDGIKGLVAVAPITNSSNSTFQGNEYLGLYPYIDLTSNTLWVNETTGEYVSYRSWLSGTKPFKH